MLDLTPITLNETARVMGFDFGTRYIGIAVGTGLMGAQPCTSLLAKDGVPNWSEVKKIIDEWYPVCLVVGIPLHMDDSEQQLTRAAKRFMQQLNGEFNLPVYGCDELLSTKEARAFLFETHGAKGLKKSAIDSYSAKIILDTWLGMQQFRDGNLPLK